MIGMPIWVRYLVRPIAEDDKNASARLKEECVRVREARGAARTSNDDHTDICI